jgi:hypothetical protein
MRGCVEADRHDVPERRSARSEWSSAATTAQKTLLVRINLIGNRTAAPVRCEAPPLVMPYDHSRVVTRLVSSPNTNVVLSAYVRIQIDEYSHGHREEKSGVQQIKDGNESLPRKKSRRGADKSQRE